MMKVPLRVIIGKSPMKTVWPLISPVSPLVNSAETYSGREYVKSLSLHSSSVYFGSRKTGFSNESDIVSEKSSIGEISSKISWSPDLSDSSSPAARRRSTLFSQASLPISQSKLSVWRERSLGTSRGSWIFAKEMRRLLLAGVREV